MTQIKATLLTGGNLIETVSFPCSDDEIMRLTEQNEIGHKATVFINNLIGPKGLKSIEGTYTTLMKATIAEAIGFDGSDDEKELLERQVNGLNDKMIAIVNESIASGEDIESREGEIKEIADTIEDLKRRIQIITENSMKNAEYADRIAEIERIITERASHQNEYDDSIVRQMVECIKVYADKHIEVIFGGGYAVEETVE